tara:strand:- start:579 stop:1274 length:696 start_codon:yes stop_codon:yes gene_type:complete
MEKIEVAVILAAGFGKRLLPITDKIPKPLVKIGSETILEKTIKLVKKLNIKKILINTHYKKDLLKKFLEEKKLDVNIEIFEEIPEILNTGGGIANMVMKNKNSYFLTFNPDTLWNESYIDEILNMEKLFFISNSKNILLVVHKDRSFDQNIMGDFNLEENNLKKVKPLNFIFTGCQIFDKKIFQKYGNKSFPMSEVWNDLLTKNELKGFESKTNFQHVTNFEIYNKLLKNN